MEDPAAPSDERQRLTLQIKQFVIEHELRPGERIGTERGIAEQFGASRSTVRHVLDRLAADGFIRPSIGRGGGAMLADRKVERNVNTILGVPTMLRQQGIACETRVLGREIAMASAAERRALALADDAYVTHVDRVRLADGTPWSLERSTFSAAMFPGLDRKDVTGSLYELLESDYSLQILDSDETVDVVQATAAQAAHLDIEPGAALVQVWRSTRGADGAPFEFAHDLFRADRIRMHLRKYPVAWRRAPAQA